MRPNADTLAQAVQILRQGGLVAFPTETVYGLGADAENELAVKRIFAVKGRPSSHPLIVHLADVAALSSWAREMPPAARKLADAFLPGALTLVLPRSQRASDAVTGGQDSVALRVPAAPVAQALLREFGGGIAAPSANRFGRVSPTTAEHVREDLSDEVDFVLDGGPCAIGLESTIVDLTHGSPAILRPGGISKEELEHVLGQAVPCLEKSDTRAPGMLPHHYAPRAAVVLADPSQLAQRAEMERAKGLRVAVLAPKALPLPEGVRHFAIPEKEEAFARVLYSVLREIDRQGFELIVAALPKASGMGLAIRDRLTRAAGEFSNSDSRWKDPAVR